MRKTVSAACLAIAILQAIAHARQPNFVVILIDDLGWTDLSGNGSTFHETPHIDRLASQGMTFANGYAAAPLCSATRACLMTGRSPARLHLTGAITGKTQAYRAEEKQTASAWQRMIAPGYFDHLPLEEKTLAEYLSEAGYATGFIGKWHLGGNAFAPERQGFSINIGGGHYPSPPSYFSPYGIDTLADGPEGEYLTDRLGEEAARFIESHRHEPFLLFLAHYAVHTPLQAKESLAERHRPKADPDSGQRNAVYAAMIQSMDESIGLALSALEKSGLADDTFVLLTSDNGGLIRIPGDPLVIHAAGEYVTSNAPLRGGKAMIYEGGIRVPMIVRWPGTTQAGASCDEPVASCDILPTVLDVAGLAPDPAIALDGASFAPLLRGEHKLEREKSLYWHFPHYIAGYINRETGEPEMWCRPAAAIRRGKYKLIEFFGENLELYNLEDDIGETRNLAEEMPGKAAAMRAQLGALLTETDAWMPAPNPAYDPKARHPATALRSPKRCGEPPFMWTFEESSEEWRPNASASLDFADGALRFTGIALDPQMTVLIDAPVGKWRFRAAVRSNQSVSAALFWASSSVPAFRPERRADIAVPAVSSGEWTEFAVEFASSSRLGGLRFDPMPDRGEMEIDWIALERAE